MIALPCPKCLERLLEEEPKAFPSSVDDGARPASNYEII
jgi:hypothetical protein